MESKKFEMELKEFEEEANFVRARKKEYSLHLKRKLQLILRDPLAEKLLQKIDRLPPMFKDEWPEDVIELAWELEDKWDVHIISTKKQKWAYSLHGLPYDDSVDPEGKYPLTIRHGSFKRLEPITVSHITTDNNRYETEILSYADKLITKKVLINLNPGHEKLLIEVDLNLIDLNDSKDIKKTIWEYIERYLRKKEQRGRKAKVFNEPQELIEIYHCGEDKFNNYLKWYDLHMGGDFETPKGYPFRTIARINLYDLIQKKCPDKLEIIKESITKLKTLNKESKKIIKKYTEESIEWEDAIDKAVKKTYKAIHRKSYPSKKQKELFNCPIHGDFCPEDCENLKKSIQIFNNRFKLSPLYTTGDMNYIEDPEGMRRPAKGKAQEIMGLQKKKKREQEKEGLKYFPKIY